MCWFTAKKQNLIATQGSWHSHAPLCVLSSAQNSQAGDVKQGEEQLTPPNIPNENVNPDVNLSAKQGKDQYKTLAKEQDAGSPSPALLLMGIINLTTDSFSDGGLYLDPNLALKHALKLSKAGADILDLGAESTRPGALPVTAEQETERLLNVLSLLKGSFSDATLPAISIDTFKASTAKKCLEHGVDIINDISGGTFDPKMLEVLGHYKPAYILGHSPARPQEMQKNPQYHNVVDQVFSFFEGQMNACIKAGLPEENIALDPCFGFGKNLNHNLELLAATPRFLGLKRPLVLAFSRKKMLQQLLLLQGSDTATLDQATHTLMAIIADRYKNLGSIIFRIHQVSGAAQSLKLSAQI